MIELAAGDFLQLEKRTHAEIPEGMLPVGLEYRGPHGTISAFYCGRPSPRLLGQEEAAALGGVTGIQLCEQEGAAWQMRLYGTDPEHAAQGTAEAETVQALLREFGLLPLPGTE